MTRFFAISVVLSLCCVLGFAQWQSRVTIGNSTWYLDLGRSPLVLPPEPHTLDDFQRTFDSFREIADSDSVEISRGPKLGFMLTEFVIIQLAISMLLVLGGLAARREIPRWLLGMTGGGVVGFVCSILLWSILGGWGPHLSTLFVIIGCVIGAFLAVVTKKTTNHPMHGSGGGSVSRDRQSIAAAP